ncbi:MAG: hypothetical protein HYS13_18975 [Planctomycetia bacterium]|nr:hypothetical protein [Planctomycetia bacterium]
MAAAPPWAAQSRLALRRSPTAARAAWDVALLLGAGALAAAAVTFLDFSLHVPGHAILRAVLPMTFGLALAPRRLGGLGLALGAGGGLFAFGLAGAELPGVGAQTSLLLTGPLLEASLHLARRGWPVHIACGAAGAIANIAALLARGAEKFFTHGPGSIEIARWSPLAAVTYPLCGLLAGLLCAIVCFRWRLPSDGPPGDQP